MGMDCYTLPDSAKPNFLREVPEVADMNQYWYSPTTIGTMVSEIEAGGIGGRIAFLSTPSIYYSLPEDSKVRANSIVFDFDRQWEKDPNFRFYDFNDNEGTLEAGLRGTFDGVVVDPPFITRDVWTLYAQAIKMCLKPDGGRMILTTVGENEAMLRGLLGPALGDSLQKTRFMPAMQRPNLPYQYSLYVNYAPAEASAMNTWNEEVPRDFEEANATRMPDEVPVAAGDLAEKPVGGSGLSFEEMLERELAKGMA